MADIRIRLTGETFFQVDNTLAAILVAALPGTIEYVKRVPAAAPPTWVYAIGVFSNAGLSALYRRKGTTVEIFQGNDPEKAKKQWPECPDAVLAQWSALPASHKVRP